MALRSCIEVVGCLYLAKRRDLIDDVNLEKFKKYCEEIVVMINALKKSLD